MSSKLRLAALAVGVSVLSTVAMAQMPSTVPMQVPSTQVPVPAPGMSPAITQRQDAMKAVGAALGQVPPVMRNERPWDGPAMATAAGTIVTQLTTAKALYPAGSTHANSRALPAIWERKAEFDGLFDRAVDAARNLQQLAAAGNEAGFRAAFPALGQSCGACHTPFRRPQ